MKKIKTIIAEGLTHGVIALAATLSVTTMANATAVTYTISNSATNANAGAGALNPGTLTGSFSFDAANNTFSAVSFDFEGLQSHNLNGSYELYSGYSSNRYDLYINGITSRNSNGQSNENSYLVVEFGAALAGVSDEIAGIQSFKGKPAGLTNPPMVAYAVPVAAVPEITTWAMMLIGMGTIGFAARRRRNVCVSYA